MSSNVIGFDVGSFNLVLCSRSEEGHYAHKREVNAFLEVPLRDRSTFNMMRLAGVHLIERDQVAYALGDAAVRMAYTMGLDLKRPMADGCVNPKERNAYEILKIMVHSLIDDVPDEKAILYFSVPADAINCETDAAFHTDVLRQIFRAYSSDIGTGVEAFPINEGLALVYSELTDKQWTGLGISCGAGLINVCFSLYGRSMYEFSIANAGDWLDRASARACGESPVFINLEKCKIDLNREPRGSVERAIHTQYRIMIEKTIEQLRRGLTDEVLKVRDDRPVDVILAGGTSSPPGFETLFGEVIARAGLPFVIGSVIRPQNPLYSVSQGCLIAAENHSV